MIHLARKMPFGDLLRGLDEAVQAGYVRRKVQATTGLTLYCYAERCTYERAWNDFTICARGIILDEAAERIVALPFPKFFNLGERGDTFPDLPFEAFEKLDGSLIIIFCHNGIWRTATKGSFDSSQAQWAQARLNALDLSSLDPSVTYLAEAVYPENRIVILYPEAALVMLGAYRADGSEFSYAEIQSVCAALGWSAAERYAFSSILDIADYVKGLSSQHEGVVVRFSSGERLKVKGDEYKRVHAMISRCTPLAMWEAMLAEDDLEEIRRQLPEEFWLDFDSIIAALRARVDSLTVRIAAEVAKVEGWSDREVGLSLASFPPDIRPFIFPWRKAGGKIDGRACEALFRSIRPTANRLDGYTPSYAMVRVAEEMA